MSSKTILILQLVGQVLAQGAILAIIPEVAQPYIQALVVVIGIVVSFFDPSATIEKLGMNKKEYLGKIK